MAKRRSNFGAAVEEQDKRKLNKENIQKAFSIFSFTKPYRLTFGVGMVFLVLSQITSMSTPLLMGQMVGAILNPSQKGGNAALQTSPLNERLSGAFSEMPSFSLNEMAMLFVGLLVLQSVFSFFRVYTFSRVSERTMRDVRRALYSKMISLPISFFEKHRVGELMSRITSDVTQLQDVLSITLAEFFRQIFTLIGGIVIISTISGKLTLFMLSTFPVLVIAAFIFGRFIRKNAKKTQDELAQTNVIVEETLQSIQVVKTFTNEAYEVDRYTSSLERVVQYALKAATFRGGFISFIIFAIFGGIVAVVWYGGTLVQAGELPFQSLFSFIFYTAFIGGSVGGLGDMYAQLQRTIGSSERILEILDEKSEVEIKENNKQKSSSNTPLSTIKINDAQFAYPSRQDVPVLQGLNLSVEAGQKVALVGHSGAGKSTIAQLLMRMYELNDGKVLLNNESVKDIDITNLRSNIAIVPQEVMLFGGTIYENIAYGKPSASKQEVTEAARKANALEFIESFPDGFETVVGERGVKLSGGQRQRVAIARAILKDPSILILDEATSALDSESEKLVQEALDGLMANRTTVIIAHRLATIRNVDKIYVIQDGKIAEEGTHETLMTNSEGIYANLVRLQFSEQSVVAE